MSQRYFIERRYGPEHYVPIGTQPSEGFRSIRDAIEWLLARGAIRRRLSVETGEPFLEGWGGERGYYARPVWRRSESSFTAGAYGTLAAFERLLRKRWYRRVIERLRRS